MIVLIAFRRWLFATILFGAFHFAPSDSHADDFPPQVPVCRGRDLLADLKTNKPQDYDRWMAAADEVPNSKAILWRIDGNGLADPSWLFGTIHVTDPRVLNIPVPVQEAFFKSTTLAVENGSIDQRWMDFFNILFALPWIYLPDDKTWEQYLTKSELDFMETELRSYGYTVNAVKRMQPWAALVSILFYPNCEAWRVYLGMNFLDAELAKWARQAGKPVIGLETRYETAKAVAGTSLESQFKTMLLFAKIAEAPEDEFETNIRIYLARRLGLYLSYEHSSYEMRPDELAAMREFEHHILAMRNITMRDRSLPLVRKGKAFIAVGAAHLPGDQGLVELFRKAGYEVTPVN